MNNAKTPQKTVDLPPFGPRNADPITDTPGSHPIETGIGAALAGAASGIAVGAVAGPLGAAIGAAVGAVAGGYAGKGVGELIDPTTEDNWLRDEFAKRPYVKPGEAFDDYTSLYQFGGRAESMHAGHSFEDVETHVRKEYENSSHHATIPWGAAKPAISDAYNRSGQLRKNRSNGS